MNSLEQRFWDKVDVTGDCWLWTAFTNPKGYGMFRVGGHVQLAHRVSYEWLVGPIPHGMQLDHRFTCPKNCVNPAHLRPATNKQQRENLAGAGRNSTTGVRGVYWNPANKRYRAGVVHNGKLIWVGSYRTAGEAEAAVIAKRNELYTHNDADRLVVTNG